MNAALSITRVVNACVFLEFGDDAVLTDPYFRQRWFMRLKEPIGMRAAELPRLTAILGGHGVFDHWQPASMDAYPHKAETAVFVATKSMQRKAITAGFERAEVLAWGETRRLSPRLELEVAPAQTALGMRVNSYVLSTDNVRVFVGTEARDLDPLREYRARRPEVDIALLPIDASAVMHHKLVMDPSNAVEGSRILGARVLIPIHYALKPVPGLLQTPGSCEQVVELALGAKDITVVPIETGRRWTYEPCGGNRPPP